MRINLIRSIEFGYASGVSCIRSLLHKDAEPMKSPTALTHRSAPPLAIPPPTCLECGHVMRIVALEPHFSFNFLDVLEYKCECSATLRFSVARLE